LSRVSLKSKKATKRVVDYRFTLREGDQPLL
jgi:hypothetical protein